MQIIGKSLGIYITVTVGDPIYMSVNKYTKASMLNLEHCERALLNRNQNVTSLSNPYFDY